MAAPLICDGGEWFNTGASDGEDDFTTGLDSGPRAGYHYRKVGIATDGTVGPYPHINDTWAPTTYRAEWMPDDVRAAWSSRVNVNWEVYFNGWLAISEQKALDVLGWATKHSDSRVLNYTETPMNFLAEAGSAFDAPSEFVLDGVRNIPRNGKKIIFEDSYNDALSISAPYRLAAIPTILSTFPMDGVVITGSDPVGAYARQNFVFTDNRVTLQMWRDYFAPLATANLHSCTHNYLRINLWNLEWDSSTSGELGLQATAKTRLFDDDNWGTIQQNCIDLSQSMSEVGVMKGVMIDNETGSGGALATDCTQYSGKTHDEVVAKAIQRGYETMQGLRSYMPDIEMSMLVSPSTFVDIDANADVITAPNGAFFAGMVRQATSSPNTGSNGLAGVRMSSASLGS